jgi:hypothetical protein
MKAMLIMAGTMACASLGTAGMAGYQWFAQEQETSNSKLCETQALQSVQSAMKAYAEGHDDLVPLKDQLLPWAVANYGQSWQIATGCDKGEYKWADLSIHTRTLAHVPLVWCAEPHGYMTKWRNVIFDDLSIRKVPEADFEAWESKTGQLQPDDYERAG